MTLKIEYPLIVLSDLHLGHPASLLQDHEPVLPLLNGMKTVVFNGDTVELVSSTIRKSGGEFVLNLKKACLKLGVQPIFLNGNHDPALSGHSHLDLFEGSVLVTHGDIIFHKIAPWQRVGDVLGSARTRHLNDLTEDKLTKLEHHLIATKKAYDNLKLSDFSISQSTFGKVAVFARECFPPWRVFRILKFWAETPGRAECLLRMFRPWTRFIIIGHTHYQGVWNRANRIVINTGSFLPVLGRSCVVMDKEELSVYKIARRKNLFYQGRLTARYKISKLKPQEIF